VRVIAGCPIRGLSELFAGRYSSSSSGDVIASDAAGDMAAK